MTAKPSGKTPPRFKLHIVALSCLAIAQPLLDVIAKNAELLVARQVIFSDLLILMAVLILIIPAALLAPGIIAKRYSDHLGDWVFLATITLLASVLALLALNDFMNGAGILAVVLAIAVGFGFTVAYTRFEPLRMFTDILATAIVIIPALFIFNSNVNRAVSGFEPISVQNIEVSSDIPIVMLVLDELPLVSLLDESGNIDRGRYPNFAALADTSNWYRNAYSVSGSTTIAVPSIASGRLDANALPVAADFPINLFTLFGPSHEMFVKEQVTTLCPTIYCSARSSENTGENTGGNTGESINSAQDRLDGFFVDLAVVYAYILLPTQLSNALPPISQSWGNFVNATNVNSDNADSARSDSASGRTLRHEEFEYFVESVQRSDTPGLYFYHALLPHVPWQYLPSGKLYDLRGTDVPGLDLSIETWTGNEVDVENGYRRHLLQVGYTDKMLGDLITKLKSENLFDEAIVVVVADHGVNFYSGEHRRGLISEELTLDILGIPLFIKHPGQTISQIHDHQVTTLDILPTILGSVGVEIPESIAGNDLAASSSSTYENFSNPYLGYQSLQSKISRFGSGSQTGLYGTGDSAELIGSNRNELTMAPTLNASFQIDQNSQLADVLLDDLVLPTLLSGQLSISQTGQQNLTLAAMLNDVVVATGRAFVDEASSQFSIMIPQDALQNGSNSLELFIVTQGADQGWELAPLLNAGDSNFRYISVSEIERSVNRQPDSNIISVENNGLRGQLDNVSLRGGFLEFGGWAADENAGAPAEYFLLEINGELIYLGTPEISRSDVAVALGSPDYEQSGFRFSQRAINFSNSTANEVRILGVSGSTASPLNSNFDLVETIRELLAD